MENRELRDAVRGMMSSPCRAIPRIILDLALWTALATGAAVLGRTWIFVATAFVIGAIPMHDLLVHGHDSTHRLVSRSRRLNDFFLWLNHALVVVSGTAYRAFHLDHHRLAHTERDPEHRVLQRLSGGRGWGYLLLPLAGPIAVNLYPFWGGKPGRIRLRMILDLLAGAALHAALILGLGVRLWLWLAVAPAYTGLAVVVVVRSICEHHNATPGNAWTNTRTMLVSPLVELAWSNTNYHLEHHLYPRVPFHEMPKLRTLLREEFARRGAIVDRGYLRTAAGLLAVSEHFGRRKS